VLAACKPRHRHQEWIDFLKQIDEGTPDDVDCLLVTYRWEPRRQFFLR
jgi:putative transposase